MKFAAAWEDKARPILGTIGFCSWFGTLAFFLMLERRSPNMPVAAAGLTSKLTNHGHDFFVLPWQALIFYLALVSSVVVGLTGFQAMNRAIKNGRFVLLLLTAAVTGLAWVALINSVRAQ